MIDGSLAQLALHLQRADDEARQVAPITDQQPGFDLASAYEVAALIHQSRLRAGASAVGRKLGFTNPITWDRYGVRDPIWAYVYDTTVVHTQGLRTSCSLRRFVDPKIEPEIILHFGKAPPPEGDLPAILACIDWVAFGFEIVQSRFPGWKFLAPDAIAASSLHGTLLVGEHVPVDQLGPDLLNQLRTLYVSLSCDGTAREVGHRANVLGSPLKAIAHLLHLLASQPRSTPLQAGELVTTGTLTSALSIHPGEEWLAEVSGIALPGLAVAFIP